VAWQSRYRYPLPYGGFAEWHEIRKDQFDDREALPGYEKRALYTHSAQPAVVPVESLGGDAEDRDPSVFEQWYVENAPDFESNPIGTRQCWLMRKAWNAACYAHAAKPTTPSPTPKKDDDNG
jgi:hypothetical protein